jgi:hypothetical protein
VNGGVIRERGRMRWGTRCVMWRAVPTGWMGYVIMDAAVYHKGGQFSVIGGGQISSSVTVNLHEQILLQCMRGFIVRTCIPGNSFFQSTS